MIKRRLNGIIEYTIMFHNTNNNFPVNMHFEYKSEVIESNDNKVI